MMTDELDFIIKEIKVVKTQLEKLFDPDKYRRLLNLVEILCLELECSKS